MTKITATAPHPTPLPKGEGGILIHGGLVIDPSQNLEAVRDILIAKGKVARVGQNLSRDLKLKDVPRIDAAGLWVTPGLIDMHVHLREPGNEEAETIATGTAAAAAGGFTTVLAMPNTEPAMDNVALANLLKAKIATDACVNVVLAGAATLGRKGEHLSEIARLAKAGVCALTDDGRAIANPELMRRALDYAADNGLVFIDHCEDEHLSGGFPLHEAFSATLKGLRGQPWAAETVIVWRDIALAELTGAHVHLAHLSAAQSVEALRWAKKRGLKVTAEVTPHHLTLCDSDIPDYDSNFKMNPPLRAKSDREALIQALREGIIDAVASDHAPHSQSKKALPIGAAPCGVIGLETSLALILELVASKKISRKQMVERMSLAPAKILGLKHKGSLKAGMDADITLIDPKNSWTVTPTSASRSQNSPFLGRKLTGRARATIVGGRIAHGS